MTKIVIRASSGGAFPARAHFPADAAFVSTRKTLLGRKRRLIALNRENYYIALNRENYYTYAPSLPRLL
mgnify:CR=1 FL=1